MLQWNGKLWIIQFSITQQSLVKRGEFQQVQLVNCKKFGSPEVERLATPIHLDIDTFWILKKQIKNPRRDLLD